jgi:hypothetical protein
MKQLKVMTQLALVAALVTASTACAFSAGKGGSSGVSQRVMLADASLDSTKAERTEALRILGQMTDLAVADRGVIATAPFQWSALATISWPINHRFSPDPADLNSYYQRLDLARQAEQVKEQAKTLFAHRSTQPGTDILGGLLAASELFASQPAGPRTLVLSSNMWAYSPSDGLNLKKQALSRAQITRLIERLVQAGKVAQLSGVCVYVVGAGLDPGRQIPNSIQLSMRTFWQAYFARTGALVRAWTPTLDTEPSC